MKPVRICCISLRLYFSCPINVVDEKHLYISIKINYVTQTGFNDIISMADFARSESI